ncbi:MAG TPA: restriction endonuclease [Burkholderiales bacterium]|nr:restriction endonuclease [Burkholderiales bacterium]
MKLRMHENSLFAILLRSPWWVSVVVAIGLFAVVRMFVPAVYAVFSASPFLVIAGIAGWRQLRAPGAGRVQERLEDLRKMSWEQFSGEVEAAFRRDGYEVRRIPGGSGSDGDFDLERNGVRRLVACKRWKAMRTGTEPLRNLLAAAERRGAEGCIYIAAGEVTENARAFCAKEGITLLADTELVKFLRPAR